MAPVGRVEYRMSSFHWIISSYSQVCDEGAYLSRRFVYRHQTWRFGLVQLENDTVYLKIILVEDYDNEIGTIDFALSLVPGYADYTRSRGELDYSPSKSWNWIMGNDSIREVVENDFFSISLRFMDMPASGTSLLVQDLKILLDSNEKVDILVNGRSFKAHKIILKARSEVFKGMFDNDTLENRTGIVKIEDEITDPDAFEDFLEYLYTGNVEKITRMNVQQLYVIADKYHVTDLKAECGKIIRQELSPDNFCDVAALAFLFEDFRLKEATDLLIAKHNELIYFSKKWILQNAKAANWYTEIFRHITINLLHNSSDSD